MCVALFFLASPYYEQCPTREGKLEVYKLCFYHPTFEIEFVLVMYRSSFYFVVVVVFSLKSV